MEPGASQNDVDDSHDRDVEVHPSKDEVEDDSSGDQGRRETAEERNDRLFSDILQELRVMQTGAQLTAGFLLTLPFQSQFDRLDDFGRRVFIALVILAALVTAIVLTPVAIHRRITGRHVKERLVIASHWFVKAALACMSLLLSGMLMLILDVVAGRVYGLIAGVGLFAVLTILLVVVPEVITRLQRPVIRQSPGARSLG